MRYRGIYLGILGLSRRLTGTIFHDVDPSEGEWAEYDEENDTSVCITGFECSVDVVKSAKAKGGGQGKTRWQKEKRKGDTFSFCI